MSKEIDEGEPGHLDIDDMLEWEKGTLTRQRSERQRRCYINEKRDYGATGSLRPPAAILALKWDLSSCEKWAYTVNICPEKFMNGRRWKAVSLKDQDKILTKIIWASVREQNKVLPMAQILDFRFEQCPKLLQQHIHLLIQCPREVMAAIDSYNMARCHSGLGWRTTLWEEIYHQDGWTKYINKQDQEDDGART